jgi:uncharacterized membrane protein SpoIIM required for sporulation
MKQQDFEAIHGKEWQELRELLDDLDRIKLKRKLPHSRHTRLPRLYRNICNHYALARGRHYSPQLSDQLHGLITRGHRRLYQRRGGASWRLIHFLIADFPRTLRAQASYFWLALALFLIPALTLGTLSYQDPEMIYSVMADEQVASMESMYDPANRTPGRDPSRSSETNFYMFGFYIKNNIGIGFRTFAGGILAGIGTLFFLIFNGLVLGSVSGHLTQLGYTDTFWTFVAGHGSFELTAIVICGAAGLMLGHGVIAPGRLSRGEAIKAKAGIALKLVMGAAAMLLAAAFVEAFWSSIQLDAAIKFSVAALLWLLVIAHLALGGRGT